MYRPTRRIKRSSGNAGTCERGASTDAVSSHIKALAHPLDQVFGDRLVLGKKRDGYIVFRIGQQPSTGFLRLSSEAPLSGIWEG
jgi:hypothetical protein